MVTTSMSPRPEALSPGLTHPVAAIRGPLIASRLSVGLIASPYEHFELRPMSPTIGAEIDGVS